jgi:polyisoprenoid-binding protein YceI
MSASDTAETEITTWNIDPVHTTAEYKAKHMMISNVKGHFSSISGVIKVDERDTANATVEVSINAPSIKTGEPQGDAYLKSDEFFDVEKLPTLTFVSRLATPKGEGARAVEGVLTIREVTHKVVFSVEGPTPPAKGPCGNLRIGLSATTKISRKDFGLVWNPEMDGGFLIADQVTLSLNVQAVKAESNAE